jgi:hypothetical protein
MAFGDDVKEINRTLEEFRLQNEDVQEQLRRLSRRVRQTDPYNSINALSRDLVDLGEVPMAKMHQTEAQTFNANTWRTVIMGATDFDFMNADIVFGFGDSKMTIRRSGIYLLNGRISFAGDTTGIRFVGFSVNGHASATRIYGGFDVSTTVARIGATDFLELDVGDTLELRGWHNNDGDLDTSVDARNQSYLVAMLVANN